MGRTCRKGMSWAFSSVPMAKDRQLQVELAGKVCIRSVLPLVVHMIWLML